MFTQSLSLCVPARGQVPRVKIPDGALTFEGDTDCLTFEGDTDFITFE